MISMLGLTLLLMIYGGVLLPGIQRYLLSRGSVAENYLKQTIPVGMGLFIFIFVMFFAVLTQMTFVFPDNGVAWLQYVGTPDYRIYLLLLCGVFVVGWIDDRYGRKDIKGLGGHIRAWTERRELTTGLIKLLMIVVLAFVFAAVQERDLLSMAAALLLLPLMTNTMNMLDLRPGRALKVFLAVCLICAVSGADGIDLIYMYPVAVSSLLLFAGDVRARFMLGDAGSNLIGFACAAGLVRIAPLWLEGLLIALLLYLHWYAEHDSLTRYIENNRMLSWLDGLGRIQ